MCQMTLEGVEAYFTPCVPGCEAGIAQYIHNTFSVCPRLEFGTTLASNTGVPGMAGASTVLILNDCSIIARLHQQTEPGQAEH